MKTTNMLTKMRIKYVFISYTYCIFFLDNGPNVGYCINHKMVMVVVDVLFYRKPKGMEVSCLWL
jgi:hypothetical protein